MKATSATPFEEASSAAGDVERSGTNARPIPDESLPDDVAPSEPLFEIAPCDPRAVAELSAKLDLNPLVAQTLARRGFTDPADAAAFIAGGDLEPADRLPGGSEAADAIARHVRAGTRIAVHGDYDVDGACSTAILVRTLKRLGASVTWHVPSRFAEGYGLSMAAVERLVADGAGLIVAVDCGVAAVDEVAHARSIGVDVVICDHHSPGPELPAAPIAHPKIAEPVAGDLCAAAVVFKVCQLLIAELGADATPLDEDLALVGLATVCDVVPLVGENRELTRRGLAAMRTTGRPGLRELMRVADVDQLSVDAGALGFRLGPRINAAGRMHSAEPAVELLLTDDRERAAELAAELSAANARRQEIERSILFDAESQARRQRDRYAIVVAGEGWHAGVLGIVAGRIAERFRRPCVALSIDNGVAAGSGRGGGSYDLLGGLHACADHLTRYGGHRAAAGLQLEAAELPAFTRAFQAHAADSLTIDDLRPRVRVDAVAEPSQLTLAAAEAIERLGPFGAGNREPSILVPAVTVVQSRRMGQTGRHLKLTVAGHGGRASIVAFGWEREVVFGDDAPLGNMVVKLRRNEFRGVVEAQARLAEHVPLPPVSSGTEAPTGADALTADWSAAFHAALSEPSPEPFADDEATWASVVDRRSHSALAAIVEQADDLAGCALLVNEPSVWADRLRALSHVDQRFAALRVAAFAALDQEKLAVGEAPVQHIIFGEPPPITPRAAAADAAARVTLAWSDADAAAAAARGPHHGPLRREHVVAAYRVLKEFEDPAFVTLGPALAAALPDARVAALAVRVLSELRLVGVERNGDSVESIIVTGGSRTELDRSETFRSYSELNDQTQRWLAQLTRTKTTLAA